MLSLALILQVTGGRPTSVIAVSEGHEFGISTIAMTGSLENGPRDHVRTREKMIG